MIATVYDVLSGAYVKYIEGPDLLNLQLNVRPGQMLVEGEHPELSFLGDDGEVAEIPEAPEGDFWVFDIPSRAWVDPRSRAELTQLLYEARERTVLDKSELLTRMFMGGLLSIEDVEVAGEGRIPPSIEPALAMLPPEAQVIARIKWRNDAVISRSNPVIVLAAAALSLSEEQLDLLFGVEAPL